MAFWLGDGHILHATGREGVDRVVEEEEPAGPAAPTPRIRPTRHSWAALVLLAAAAGCGSGHPSATRTKEAAPTTTSTTSTQPAGVAPAHEFPEFRIAMDEATDYLDPGLSDTAEAWGVMWNVYLPLLGYRHASRPAGARRSSRTSRPRYPGSRATAGRTGSRSARGFATRTEAR